MPAGLCANAGRETARRRTTRIAPRRTCRFIVTSVVGVFGTWPDSRPESRHCQVPTASLRPPSPYPLPLDGGEGRVRNPRPRLGGEGRVRGRGLSGRGRIAATYAQEDSMTYDLLIKNGLMVDGTGAPARQADVAIKGGKIAEIGRVKGGATTEIDASDLVVAPGFIDPHTHYDAQICWDGAVTPSSWHGVTSVVMGNCGVGIAPCRPESREIAMKDLVNVEGIPFEVLDAGITWDWESFPQYLDAAARRHPALNLAFLAPLTPFRHYVMGEASLDRAADGSEISKIK